jgi:hypothetical protein
MTHTHGLLCRACAALAMTFLFFAVPAFAGGPVPFTINMSEAVNVSGCPATCPRIAVDVGGTTRYAVYSAGSGTNTLTFTYQMVSGDVDADGVQLVSPIQLNGGTIKDAAGNDATLTFVPPDTSGILVDASVPSGYTATFADRTVTNINKAAMGLTLNYTKANRTYNYTISSSGGGTPLTGTGTTTGAAQSLGPVNLTSLPDGKLTLSMTLTDSLGGVGTAASDIVSMAVLDNSLVGHWTFDANDISGTTAYDRSGNGKNGILSNNPVPSNQSLSYSGNYETVRMYGLSGTLSSFSSGLWFKTMSSSGTLLDNGNTRLYLSLSGGHTAVKVFNSAGENFQIISNATYNDGLWHLLFAVWDGSIIRMYMDGSQVKTGGTYTQPWQMQNDWFWVGSYNYGACPGQCFGTITGNIDDPRFYNRTLTPAEIATIYNAGH